MRPPKKKNSRPTEPEDTTGKRPGERQPPAMAERTGDEGQRTETGTPSHETHEQVTNHDEQEKITNTDDSDTPIAEN